MIMTTPTSMPTNVILTFATILLLPLTINMKVTESLAPSHSYTAGALIEDRGPRVLQPPWGLGRHKGLAVRRETVHSG